MALTLHRYIEHGYLLIDCHSDHFQDFATHLEQFIDVDFGPLHIGVWILEAIRDEPLELLALSKPEKHYLDHVFDVDQLAQASITGLAFVDLINVIVIVIGNQVHWAEAKVFR
jgi:hypothetical protein